MIKIKKGCMKELSKYKFKKFNNIYKRKYYPKIFGIIPLFLSKRKSTVIIAGDRTIYMIDINGEKVFLNFFDEEIEDLRHKNLLEIIVY